MRELISKYQNKFAIIMSISTVFSLSAFVVFMIAIYEIHLFVSQSSSSTYILYGGLRTINTLLVLCISLYFILCIKIIDRHQISYRFCFIIALIYAFFIDTLQIIIFFIYNHSGLFIDYLIQSNFFSDVIWIMVVLAASRINFKESRVFFKIFLISTISVF